MKARFATPRLPRRLLHRLSVTETQSFIDKANGGQSRKKDVEVASFRGVVMPLSNQDWKQLPEGSFTLHTCKVYTDDKAELKPGQHIVDRDGRRYVVKTVLEHNSIHPLFRCLVEAVER